MGRLNTPLQDEELQVANSEIRSCQAPEDVAGFEGGGDDGVDGARGRSTTMAYNCVERPTMP
jgi:hypothetical protein